MLNRVRTPKIGPRDDRPIVAKDDGRRLQPGEATQGYEWWYFQVQLEGEHDGAVVTVTFDLMGNPDKKPADVIPTVMFELAPAGAGPVLETVVMDDKKVVRPHRRHCHVSIGSCSVESSDWSYTV